MGQQGQPGQQQLPNQAKTLQQEWPKIFVQSPQNSNRQGNLLDCRCHAATCCVAAAGITAAPITLFFVAAVAAALILTPSCLVLSVSKPFSCRLRDIIKFLSFITVQHGFGMCYAGRCLLLQGSSYYSTQFCAHPWLFRCTLPTSSLTQI